MNQFEDRLEAYLDNLLSDSERAEFERALSTNPVWRAQVERQRDIDAHIRQAYRAPVDRLSEWQHTNINPKLSESKTVPFASTTKPSRRMLLVAASVGLVLLAGWQVRQFFTTPKHIDPYAKKEWRNFEQQYAEEAKGDYKPAWICKDDATFAKFVNKRFGQPLLLATLPAGTEALGWSYSNSISEQTAHILGRVNGQKVLVFVDRAERDDGRAAAEKKTKEIFRREVGELVVYEVTPLDHPSFLDKFYQPTATP